ncbi:MAG: sigma-54-dependent Fis family transcriptional regulator [Deltaproteobacteria bacterium]|nr:sigma-54-dependent Fis family transcriptional regulator [Deltaproteobacteria bacterium]
MNVADILFVDDDRAILEIVREYLTETGYRVDVVDNGLAALERIKDKPYHIVFTDIKMPDIDGLELLSAIKEYRPETEVIIVTGHGSMESAIQAMKYGSYDYLQKPFKLNVLKIIIDRILDEKKLKQEKIVLKTRVKDRHRYDALVGVSLRMQEIYDTIERMRQASPNVLIEGESGTGKELAAHVIHRTSDRSQNPFVTVTCQSIFKHVAPDRYGERIRELLGSAREGALFLDEVCELPVEAQAELTAILREQVLRQGVDRSRSVRIIAATNRSVKEAVARGSLAKDLGPGLHQVFIQMPSLKDRKEDICLLINHFLHQFNARSPHKVLAVAPEAMDYLLGYHWPGNVIQLENVIERAFALGVELVIQIDDLPAEIRTAGEIHRMS